MMKIGFIGAGKVGFSLGRYFTDRGVSVSGYYSKSPNSAKEAAEFTNTKYYRTKEELIEESDALFFTVPDGSIHQVYCETAQSDIEGKCFVHCSGALPSSVFSGISKRGAKGCSIHPICAVSDKLTGAQELSKSYFTIEGDDAEKWADFFRGLGSHAEVLSPEAKVKYHAAAVFASNLVTGLYDLALELMLECGLSKAFGERALLLLLTGNTANIAARGVTEALTGPVERADAQTVEKHLKALAGDEREVYRLLSMRLVGIAARKNPQRNYDEVAALLQGGVDPN